MSSWKYKTAILQAGMLRYKWKDEQEDLSVEDALQRFGLEGWELVNTPSYQISGSTTEFIFIFKKPA